MCSLVSMLALDSGSAAMLPVFFVVLLPIFGLLPFFLLLCGTKRPDGGGRVARRPKASKTAAEPLPKNYSKDKSAAELSNDNASVAQAMVSTAEKLPTVDQTQDEVTEKTKWSREVIKKKVKEKDPLQSTEEEEGNLFLKMETDKKADPKEIGKEEEEKKEENSDVKKKEEKNTDREKKPEEVPPKKEDKKPPLDLKKSDEKQKKTDEMPKKEEKKAAVEAQKKDEKNTDREMKLEEPKKEDKPLELKRSDEKQKKAEEIAKKKEEKKTDREKKPEEPPKKEEKPKTLEIPTSAGAKLPSPDKQTANPDNKVEAAKSDAQKDPTTTLKKPAIEVTPKQLAWTPAGGQKRLRIANNSPALKALKLKCSDNGLFIISPVFATLPPGKETEVTVTRQPGALKQDKVVVCWAACLEKDSKDMAAFFKRADIQIETLDILQIAERSAEAPKTDKKK